MVSRSLSSPSFWRLAALVLPWFAAVVWAGALLALLIVWVVRGQPIYDSMSREQTWAFISDIGATNVQPAFIVACAANGFTLVYVLSYLHFIRRPNHHGHERRKRLRTYGYLSIGFASAGALCVLLLSIFNTDDFPTIHRTFLFVFLVGDLLSAIFTVLELRILTRPPNPVRSSYRAKLYLLIVLGCAVAAFIVCLGTAINAAMVLEWFIAFVFTLWILSFWYDVRVSPTHPPQEGDVEKDLAGPTPTAATTTADTIPSAVAPVAGDSREREQAA